MIKDKKNLLNIALTLVTIIGLIVVWLISALAIGEEIILPTPFETISEVFLLMKESGFWLGLLSSLGRSLIAFLISFVLGFALAVLVKFYKFSAPVVKVIVAILRAIPTIAIVLLLLLWTNSRLASMIVTMLVVLPTIFSMMQVALTKIDYDIIEMCKIYNVPKKKIFLKYIMPIILTEILRAIGSVLSLNIKLIVASEVLAGTANSIGSMMSQSKIYFETSRLFALVIIMISIAVIIELVFNIISTKVGKKNGLE